MGISQKGVDHLESISIRKTTNAYTPPDLRLKVPREERERIYERVKAGEPQTQVVADYKITQPRVAQIVKQVEKTRKAEGSRPQSPELDLPEEISVRIGDFREIARELPPESIDLVFTDPPYSEEHLELWESLGEVARRLLKPGRYLLAYVGKLYLPALMNALGKHLDYYWTAGKYFDQGHVFVRARKMWDQWRPILIFQKPGADSSHEWCLDMVRMGSREEAKRFHEQGQSSEDARYYIQKFTRPGEVVLDTCCGSGGILLAAKSTGRRAIGIDIDPQAVARIRARLANDRASVPDSGLQ